MKILNIFKKQNKKTVVTTHKLNKNQLEKVIGGGDGVLTNMNTSDRKSGSIILAD